MMGLPNPYVIGGAALVLVASAGGAFVFGDSVGANRVIARDAAAFAKLIKAAKEARLSMDKATAAAAQREDGRRVTVREIYERIPQIVDRPVYRNECIDADGVSILDAAADNANGKSAGSAARASTGIAEDPARH